MISVLKWCILEQFTLTWCSLLGIYAMRAREYWADTPCVLGNTGEIHHAC